jgi:hypothetical protein
MSERVRHDHVCEAQQISERSRILRVSLCETWRSPNVTHARDRTRLNGGSLRYIVDPLVHNPCCKNSSRTLHIRAPDQHGSHVRRLCTRIWSCRHLLRLEVHSHRWLTSSTLPRFSGISNARQSCAATNSCSCGLVLIPPMIGSQHSNQEYWGNYLLQPIPRHRVSRAEFPRAARAMLSHAIQAWRRTTG